MGVTLVDHPGKHREFPSLSLRVELLLKNDNGYPKDAEDTLFTLANPFLSWVTVANTIVQKKMIPKRMSGLALLFFLS